MSNLFIHFEDTEAVDLDRDKLRDWIELCIKEEGCELVALNFVFTSDEYLLDINKKYLNHDYYTDIITFDNSEVTSHVEGDLFVSLERVRDNSTEVNTSFELELYRVMIHGVLHLLGYDDKGEEEIELMRTKENTYLSLLKN